MGDKMQDTAVKTYEPDNSLKKGRISVLIEIYYELINNRWLTYQLFKRDFLATYMQSLIGISWAFIIPLVSVGSFIILNRSGIFSVGSINLPYPIFAVLGIALWQLFSTGLIISTNSLVKAGSMIVKINFSKKSLVIASYAQSFIPFLIQFALLLILYGIYGIMPNAKILLLPLLILPVILFSFGIGLLFSLLNAVLRDIGNILSVLLTFLMFMTPVFYTKPANGILSIITAYNPLFYLVSVPRDIILSGHTTNLYGFITASILSAIIFIVCIVVFHITEVRIAERV
jgi:lipopolysaccharide transport system permease protein